jgi:hypothetical protein
VVFSVTEKAKFVEKAFGSGVLARNGRNIDVRCPIPECESRKDRSKRKLAIRVEDDANHCWVCGWRARSLVPLLVKYGTQALLDEYRSKFYSGPAGPSQIATVEAAKQPITLPSDFRPLVACKASDPDARAVRAYAWGRGLLEHDFWYYKLGTSDDPRWRRRLLMPSFDATGTLNFFVGRAIDDKRRPKYDNPDTPKKDFIFNELNVDWTQRLVICEGPLDLVKCGDNAVPLLGSMLTEDFLLFEKILLNRTPVALALDCRDMKWKMQKYARKLAEYDLDVVIVDTGEKNDPGEIVGKTAKIYYDYLLNGNYDAFVAGMNQPELFVY